MYGRMVGDKRQGHTVLTVLGAFWLISSSLMVWAVSAGAGVGLGEGFEQCLSVAPGSLFATATTLTSTGAVNVAHDPLPPLAGALLMLNMMTGEVAPGGIGSGLYGMLVLAIVTVFIAGLMVGRTPEFLGKKISARQMTLVALYILMTPFLVLAGTATTVALGDLSSAAPAVGPPGCWPISWRMRSSNAPDSKILIVGAVGGSGWGTIEGQPASELRIIDRGRGVPAAAVIAMFQPFQRLDDVSYSAAGGPGIGLGPAVAKGFMETMGGVFEAEPTPGGGLTMVVRLPISTGVSRRRVL
ncbi:potassium-transporting ATPase subunit KdpA [Paeniglutamicibacter antarcticus]|uniref:histidine kinase n=2 Tax=Arthrobacter terrae TaxID=2935737 RepID=A0A931G6B8_9MICC|nr:potassium-transporting ATPase subunit KdpA [Arthrobacter terrae]